MSLYTPTNPLQDGGSNLDLMFITQTGPKKSKKVQSQIRKHVMKDIGKARRKEGKRGISFQFTLEVPDSLGNLGGPPVEPQDPVHQLNQLTLLERNVPAVYGNTFVPSESGSPYGRVPPLMPQRASQPTAVIVPSIERLWTGRMDPFIQYPIKMDHHSRKLIDHVFDDRYGNTPPYRDAWLPLGMTNASTFHQVLSNAALNLASLRSRDVTPESRVSMMHHTKSVMLVKESMSDKRTATSDSVIASITAFACYSHVTGNQAGWHLHMNAVKEIIRLRGGIDSLNSNRGLRVAMFWVDIGGSCTEDIHPIFPIPTKLLLEVLGPDDSIPPPALAAQLSQSWNNAFPQHTEIMNIMNELRSFMSYLKSSEVRDPQGKVYRRGELFASNMLTLQHRLQSLISLSDDDAEQKVNILRLGCTLCMAEIRRLFGIMGVLSFSQTAKLRGLLEEQTHGWEPFALLKAWVLAMGAIESQGVDRAWFFAELEKAKMELGVDSWESLEGEFRQILWYDVVHDQMFLELRNGVEPVSAGGHLLGGSRFGGYRPL